ncbi:MAG: hypothetical protein V3575_04425, partial [Candidatus Absconditabacteria bacterium]
MNNKTETKLSSNSFSLLNRLQGQVQWTGEETLKLFTMGSLDLLAFYESLFQDFVETKNMDLLKKLIIISDSILDIKDEKISNSIKVFIVKQLYEIANNIQDLPIIFRSIVGQNLLELIYQVGDYTYFQNLQTDISNFVKELLTTEKGQISEVEADLLLGYTVTIVSNYSKLVSVAGDDSFIQIHYKKIIQLLNNNDNLANKRYLLFIGLDTLNYYIDELRLKLETNGKIDKNLMKTINSIKATLENKLVLLKNSYYFKIQLRFCNFKLSVINNNNYGEKDLKNLEVDLKNFLKGKTYEAELLSSFEYYKTLSRILSIKNIPEKSKMRGQIIDESESTLIDLYKKSFESNSTALQIQVLTKLIALENNKEKKKELFYSLWEVAKTNLGEGFVNSKYLYLILRTARNNFMLNDFFEDESLSFGEIDINEKISDYGLLGIISNAFQVKQREKTIEMLRKLLEVKDSNFQSNDKFNINIWGNAHLSESKKNEIKNYLNEMYIINPHLRFTVISIKTINKIFNIKFNEQEKEMLKSYDFSLLNNEYTKIELGIKGRLNGFDSNTLLGKKLYIQ